MNKKVVPESLARKETKGEKRKKGRKKARRTIVLFASGSVSLQGWLRIRWFYEDLYALAEKKESCPKVLRERKELKFARRSYEKGNNGNLPEGLARKGRRR